MKTENLRFWCQKFFTY